MNWGLRRLTLQNLSMINICQKIFLCPDPCERRDLGMRLGKTGLQIHSQFVQWGEPVIGASLSNNNVTILTYLYPPGT